MSSVKSYISLYIATLPTSALKEPQEQEFIVDYAPKGTDILTLESPLKAGIGAYSRLSLTAPDNSLKWLYLRQDARVGDRQVKVLKTPFEIKEKIIAYNPKEFITTVSKIKQSSNKWGIPLDLIEFPGFYAPKIIYYSFKSNKLCYLWLKRDEKTSYGRRKKLESSKIIKVTKCKLSKSIEKINSISAYLESIY